MLDGMCLEMQTVINILLKKFVNASSKVREFNRTE